MWRLRREAMTTDTKAIIGTILAAAVARRRVCQILQLELVRPADAVRPVGADPEPHHVGHECVELVFLAFTVTLPQFATFAVEDGAGQGMATFSPVQLDQRGATFGLAVSIAGSCSSATRASPLASNCAHRLQALPGPAAFIAAAADQVFHGKSRDGTRTPNEDPGANVKERPMPDLEDLRDLWEIDLELAGSDQGPIPIITTPPEQTWVWSDLHFGDRGALYAFQRPFGDVDQMNHHLLREWRRRVRSDDTIICLGDVAHPDAWRDRRLVLDIRDCPGKRVLVLGNHDLNREDLRGGGVCNAVLAGAVRHRPAAGPEPLPAAPDTGGRGQPPRTHPRRHRADPATHQRHWCSTSPRRGCRRTTGLASAPPTPFYLSHSPEDLVGTLISRTPPPVGASAEPPRTRSGSRDCTRR